MSALLKKELKSYFANMVTYVFIAFMIAVVGFFSTYYNFTYGLSSFSTVFYSCYFIALILIPFLTMRMFALEKQMRTVDLLYSLPISTTGIVISKLVAAVIVFSLPILFFCLYPVILGLFGTVNYLLDYTCIAAFFLMGVALISVGMFISALCETQGVAAIVGFAALLCIYLMPDISGMMPTLPLVSVLAFTVVIILIAILVYRMTLSINMAVSVAVALNIIMWIFYFINKDYFAGLFSRIVDRLSLFTALVPFLNGMFDLGGILLYISVSFVFVFLTVIALEKKRYC